MALQWLLDRREFWAPALIGVSVAIVAPFFPRWGAWLRAAVLRLFARAEASSEECALQEPKEVLRFVEDHEPELFSELSQQRAAFVPLSPAAIYHRHLDFWLEHGLPLLGKYGSRASDQSLIDLFRYFHGIGLGLHDRGDGSSRHYLTRNPLDVRIGSQIDPAFYPTADRLLASLLFSAVGQPPQKAGDGEALFASVVQRAIAADAPPLLDDDAADAAGVDQVKAAQYLAILHETLQSDRGEAAAILRHLLAVTVVHPAAFAFVAGGEPPDSALHFHEDGYCLTQLLPRTALAFCADELKTIAAFSAAHRDGDFFTDVYMRKPSPYGLPDLCISRRELSDIVGSKLPFHRLVTTGYGSHVESVPRTIGFGPTSSCCLFAEFDETGMLQCAWLQLWPGNLAYYDGMRAALADLGAAYDLIVADWTSADLFAINDRDALSRYLADCLSPMDTPPTRH